MCWRQWPLVIEVIITQDLHLADHFSCPVWKTKFKCELFQRTNVVIWCHIRYIMKQRSPWHRYVTMVVLFWEQWYLKCPFGSHWTSAYSVVYMWGCVASRTNFHAGWCKANVLMALYAKTQTAHIQSILCLSEETGTTSSWGVCDTGGSHNPKNVPIAPAPLIRKQTPTAPSARYFLFWKFTPATNLIDITYIF